MVTPAKDASVNPLGSSGPPVENSRVPKKSPREDRPAQGAQKVVQVKRKERNTLGSGDLPVGSARVTAPNNPALVNPPESSRPPVKFAPVLTANNPSRRLVNLHLETLATTH